MVFMCWFKPLGLNQPTLHLSYEDRLIKLNLTTLERRRESGDIIQIYKIMHGLSDVNINELFTMVTNGVQLSTLCNSMSTSPII